MIKLLLVNAYREMRNWFLETGGKESLLFNGRKLSSIEAFSCTGKQDLKTLSKELKL